MFKKFFFILSLLFLFWGCETDYPVYSGFCSKEKSKPISCLKYDIFMDSQDKKTIEKKLIFKESKSCDFSLKLTKYYVGKCSNPDVKSRGVGSNGYIRMEIIEKGKCYFRAQNEFDSDEKGAFFRVLERIKKSLVK
jgi:hypothetical protein